MTITFEGLANFRDLGGIPVAGGGVVRSGTLFRSDSLSYATEADASLLLGSYGLRTVVDLRDVVEVDEFGRGPLAQAPVGYVSVPVGDVIMVDTRHDFYIAMLDVHGDQLAGLLRRLADPQSLPALVHCHIGCDRTGVVSALVLSLIGVANSDVCTDYARSSRASRTIRQRSEQRRRQLGLPVMDDSYYDAWEPHPGVMAETLRLAVQRWGGPGGLRGWADAYGVTGDDIDALREALVIDALCEFVEG